jgi:pimeloyl-ACP methyl ester carboxylesterase
MKKLLTYSLILFFGFSLFTACTKNGSLPPIPRKTFVLVHGAWQAPWVWDQVKQNLEKAGQKVAVVTLPGHGSDFTNPATITLDGYRDVVVHVIDSISGAGDHKNSSRQKIILVGHSLAGMIISEVAEAIPGEIEKLIYIGAYLPANDSSLLSLANTDAQSLLGPALIQIPGPLLDVPIDKVDDIFCQDCSVSMKKELIQNYRAEPLIPFINPAKLTAANFGAADKYYIHTLQDHVVGPDLQNRMIAIAGIPVTKVFPINSSHSPFLSHPDETTALLLHIAQ